MIEDQVVLGTKEKKEKDTDVVADGRQGYDCRRGKPNKAKERWNKVVWRMCVCGEEEESGISSPWSSGLDRQVAAADGDLKEGMLKVVIDDEHDSCSNRDFEMMRKASALQIDGRWGRAMASFATASYHTGAIQRKPNWDIASQAQQESGIGATWGFMGRSSCYRLPQHRA